MSRKGWILVGIPLVFQVLLLAAALYLENQRTRERASQEALETLIESANDLSSSLFQIESGLRGFLISDNPVYVEQQSEAAAKVPGRVRRLAALLSARGQDPSVLVSRALAIERYQDEQRALARSGRKKIAVARVGALDGKRRWDAFLAELERHLDRERVSQRIAEEHLTVLRSRVYAVLIGGGILNLFLAIALALFFKQQISGRFERVMANVRRAERGEDVHAPLDETDEIGALHHAVVAMAQKRAEYERTLLEQTTDQSLMIEFQQEIARNAHSPEKVSALIVEYARTLASADGAMMLRIEEDVLVVEAAAGGMANFAGKQIPKVEGLWSEALRLREVVSSDDVAHDPRAHPGVPSIVKQLGGRPLVVVPVQYAERDYGVIVLRAGDAHSFDATDISTLKVITGFLGAALTHSHHFQEIEALVARRTDELRHLNLDLERRVAERTEELDRFFTLSLDMLCVAGYDGYYKRLNPAWTHVLGWSEEELLARPFLELVHPDDREVTAAEAGQLAAGGTTFSFENRYQTKEGAYRWMLWTAAGVPEQQVIYATARDITEQKHFEQTLQKKNSELERANQTKDHFLALMSHELRTPLNAIIGFTGTLLLKLPGPLNAAQEKQLQTIRTSARHLLSLINDILDVAKIEAGKVEIHLEPAVCQNVIEEVASIVRPAAEQKGLRLDLDLPLEEVVVQTDRRRLLQVVLNLANNAVKFTENGSVKIALRRYDANGRPAGVEIEVADTGIGIRPEARTRLFQPFEQTHAAESKHYEGTGLGLHLSQKLAALLGGEIRCSSEYGKGSRFTLLLDAPALETREEA